MSLLSYRQSEFTLPELAAAAGGLLRGYRVQAPDGRVSDSPDTRTIRYYQTLGLIDRPLRYDGRRAVYGYRHLLQLLAIKGLQEEGQPLGIIQGALAGRSSEHLERALSSLSGEPASVDPIAAASAPVAPRPLVSAEVAPGITVTIDPDRVGDPRGALARVAGALAQRKEAP